MIIAIAIVVFVQSLLLSFVLGMWAYKSWQQRQMVNALNTAIPAAAALVTSFVEAKNGNRLEREVHANHAWTKEHVCELNARLVKMFEDLRSMILNKQPLQK